MAPEAIKPLHREDLPARRCPCGTWLSSANPTAHCATCNGGEWLHVSPAAITSQVHRATREEIGENLEGLMSS